MINPNETGMHSPVIIFGSILSLLACAVTLGSAYFAPEGLETESGFVCLPAGLKNTPAELPAAARNGEKEFGGETLSFENHDGAGQGPFQGCLLP